MTDNLNNNLKSVIETMSRRFHEETINKTKEQIKSQWLWKWDDAKSIEYNTYEFYKHLKCYDTLLREWEEHHNGICCVVERVRDEYLIPKIKLFLKSINENNK